MNNGGAFLINQKRIIVSYVYTGSAEKTFSVLPFLCVTALDNLTTHKLLSEPSASRT